MTVRTQTLKKFARLEKHHSVGSWQLVLCDSSRYGQRLPEIDICLHCGHYEKRQCFLGNSVTSQTKACKQAIPRKRERP